MRKEERKIYTRCIAVMAVYIISAVYFYTTPSQAHTADIAKNAPYGGSDGEVKECSAEPSETPEMGQIREMSGMPCVNREQFERWYATYEPQTEEEESSQWVDVAETAESEQEVREIGAGTVETVLYSVNGETLNPELQAYLYQRLADHNIEWFMPYAIMIAYQESKFDIYAVNPTNHVDCGLFQFRSYYYPGQDIFNPYEQIDIFCQQMANRSQYDVYEMISRHNVSDFGSYNEVYVGQVLAHEQNLRKVN